MMCNRLTIKVTKFQQSNANRFRAVAKNYLGGGEQICLPYKLGLTIGNLDLRGLGRDRESDGGARLFQG